MKLKLFNETNFLYRKNSKKKITAKITNPRGDPGQEQPGQEQAEYGAGDDAVDGERQLGDGVPEGVEEERAAHDEDAQQAPNRLAHQQPLLLRQLRFHARADKVLGHHVRERVLTGGNGAVEFEFE